MPGSNDQNPNGQNNYHQRPGFFARRKLKKQLRLKIKKEKQSKPMTVKNKQRPKSGLLGAFSSLITMFLVIALVAAMGVAFFWQLVDTPNEIKQDRTFSVQSGDGLRRIASRLEEEGFIVNQELYTILVSLEGNDTRLKIGDYNIPKNSSMRQIMNIFVRGQSIQHKLTFAEGLSTSQILDKIRKAPLLSGEISIEPDEGSLMPDTYLYPKGMSRDKIITQMMNAQKKFLEGKWETRQEGLPLNSIEEAVILASIVEKETGIASERPLVAAAFTNRLKKKMKLQSDPTIIYGITQGAYKLGRPLRKSEIKGKTAYNTYVIDRLPPTPIANPGRESILAVLNPANVDYVFFVADGTGGHVFAKTYKEHQKNVKKWRAIEKANKKKG